MGACSKQTYNNVTPACWQCGVGKAKSYGIDIREPSGHGSKDGFTIAWNYDAGAQTASLQCTDSPWYIPCSIINSKINDEVEDCLKQHDIEMTAML